jgi:hypothetical protein
MIKINNEKYKQQDVKKIIIRHQKVYFTYEEMIKDGKCPTGTPLFVCKNSKKWIDRKYFDRLKNKEDHTVCKSCIMEICKQVIRHNNLMR